MEKVPLSVAIITRNEEENIRACLKSVSFAGQIVLVDSGSTDKTLEIAAAFGCEIYSKGACMLIRKKALDDAGFFDDRYFFLKTPT